MKSDFVSPERGEKAFTCPHCAVLARQYSYSNPPDLSVSGSYVASEPIASTVCEHCGAYALWHNDTMVYSARGKAPPPNPDMPQEVLRDYEEAAAISGQSPRGAAALLRLAIQKLVASLGGTGNNLNKDIGNLVQKGLSPRVQQALDIVRVTGNNAVHPGQIDTDDPEVVGQSFRALERNHGIHD